jgi:NAD/NADP transhydrogenase beta subunit
MPQNKNTSSHRHFAELLDSKFRIPGTNIRFGIDPIIGLIPGAGDVLVGIISLYFLIQAAIIGGSVSVLGRMSLNILLDVLIGSIPILGEAFDVYWKANIRNARLLEELQQDPEQTERQSKVMVWSVCIFLVALVFALLYVIGKVIISLIELIL